MKKYKKKMKKYKVIALVGKAGSGKDSLCTALIDQLQDEGFKANKVVSYTTRPPRDKEIDGKDYYFVTPQEIASLIFENKILEATEFNNWFYATGIDKLYEDVINVAVVNPAGIESISEDSRIDLCVIECLCSDKERIIRQLNREFNPDIDEIFRRYKADREDFSDFNPFKYTTYSTYVHTDEGLTVSEEATAILEYVRRWANVDN